MRCPLSIVCALLLAHALLPLKASALEEPAFEVVAQFKHFEVRRYDPFVIAEVEINGSFEEAGNQAFNTLFEYISGANYTTTEMEMTAPVLQQPSAGQMMAMTAPVLQSSSADAATHRVSFVLPLRYRIATAPRPSDARVQLREVPGRLMAAIRYSGFWSEEGYREQESRLVAALTARGYEALGPPEWARYNAPFMPWFLRRNEVLVEVGGEASALQRVK